MAAEVIPVPGLGKGRLETLADGIFATVMTVLALSLSVPLITAGSSPQSVPEVVMSEAPLALSYIFSFGILGVFWVAHHVMMHYIRRVNRSFLWINILFLLTLGFVPFTTALLGRHLENAIALTLYGGNVTGIGFALVSIWIYATNDRRLVDSDLDERIVSAGTRRTMFGPILYAIGVGVSYVAPLVTLVIFAAVPVTYIFPGLIDRWWPIPAADAAHQVRIPDRRP
jgi:TMEM175 potassium channel family protein